MTTNESSIEEKRRRMRRFWLYIAGGTGALTLIVPALVVIVRDGLRYPWGPPLPNPPPLGWYQTLGISILLGIGPMLSMVICWHFIVNRARHVTWYRGLLAGWIASVLAYPLTAIVAVLLLSFSIGMKELLPILPGLLLLALFFSLFSLFSLTGLATSLLGVVLGSLLGWLQERDEARLAW